MLCPSCNQNNDYVKDSRFRISTNTVYRRRVCNNCGERFSTYEVLVSEEEMDRYMSLRVGSRVTERIGHWEAKFVTSTALAR